MASSKIYVGNLDPRIAERDLKDEFERYGRLRSVWVARKPPGFAFIDFEDPRDAEDAVRKLDGVQGWRVEISRTGPRGGGGGGFGGGGGGGDRFGGGGGGGGGRELRCYECNEVGHIARDCRLRQAAAAARRRSRSPRRSPSPGGYRRRSVSPVRRSRSPVRRERERSRSPRSPVRRERSRSPRSPPPPRRERSRSPRE